MSHLQLHRARPTSRRRAANYLIVLAALATAWMHRAGAQPTPPARSEPAPPAAAVESEAEVRRLIERYFLTWSSQDLERYGRCFMPQAAIQFISPSGRLSTMPLGAFLKSQHAAQQNAAQPMTETAENVDIRFEADLARVVVYWKLVDGARIEYGYDHFTLMKSAGQWRIANLVFYAQAPARRDP